jgi:hypothetical protein
MKLSEISSSRPIEIRFPGGAILNVTYDPVAITPEMEDRLSTETETKQIIEILLAVVKEWDLVEDGTDEAVPLTAERLQTLPLVASSTVVRAIARDLGAQARAEGKT